MLWSLIVFLKKLKRGFSRLTFLSFKLYIELIIICYIIAKQYRNPILRRRIL
jgi:hypothetical protein